MSIAKRASADALTLQGPAGDIETRIEGEQQSPAFLALVCHPHPLFGGSMDNKVVTTLTRAARQRGAVALRFNFRGVGASQGSHGGGLTETDDLLAVVHWMCEQWPERPLWLAGFSFGAWVARRGAAALTENQQPAARLLLVAPPVHHHDFETLSAPNCPVTVVLGEQDEVVPVGDMLDWANSSALRPQLVRFADTGHFFHGRLVDLAAVADDTFPPGTGKAAATPA